MYNNISLDFTVSFPLVYCLRFDYAKKLHNFWEIPKIRKHNGNMIKYMYSEICTEPGAAEII